MRTSSRSSLRRGLAGLAAALASAVAMSALIPAVAHADDDEQVWTITRTGGIGVKLRDAAALDAVVGYGPQEGEQVVDVCQVMDGDPVGDHDNRVWHFVRSSRGETWIADTYLHTPNRANKPTPGTPFCDTSSGTPGIQNTTTSNQPAVSEDEAPSSSGDPCIERYPNGGRSTSSDIIGGTETRFPREASLYQVCQGFGAPEDLELSPGMKCALIAAAATYGGPQVNLPVSRTCDTVNVITAIETGGWTGAALSKGCDYLGGIFAGGVGIYAAGAAAATGPGAVAVGRETYRALAASLKVACGGIFDDGAHDFGVWLEANHESNIAVDIARHGKCLREQVRFGLISWSAVDC